MVTAWILLTSSVLGANEIEFGYQPSRNGGYDYLLQLQPDVVDKIRNGQTISAPLETWMHVSRLVVTVATPNSRQLPHEKASLVDDERFLKSIADLEPDSRLPSDLEFGFTPLKDGYDVQIQLSNSELNSLARGETITKDIPDWLHMRDYRVLFGNTPLKQQPRETAAQARTTRWGSDSTDTTSSRTGQLKGITDPMDGRETTTSNTRDDGWPSRRTAVDDRADDPREPITRKSGSRTLSTRDNDFDQPPSTPARRSSRDFATDDDPPPRSTTPRKSVPINDPREDMSDWNDRGFSTAKTNAPLPRSTPAPTTAAPAGTPAPVEAPSSNNWMVALGALALSLGGNAYLGMIASQQRARYWDLADRFRREFSEEGGSRERGSSRHRREEALAG